MAGIVDRPMSSSQLRELVKTLYPDALSRTYCVPPVRYSKAPGHKGTLPCAGHSTTVKHPPTGPPSAQSILLPDWHQLAAPSDHWAQEPQPLLIPRVTMQEDDFAQNQVMLNLEKLGNSRKEAMFVMSELNFTADATRLSRPTQLDRGNNKLSANEADILVIHRKHGILIGEVRSVGQNQAVTNMTPDQADADVARKVRKAIKQLDNLERAVMHLVSDVAPGLTVRTTLFLPYVSSQQLKRVLDNDSSLGEAVCQSLGAADAEEAVRLCCCSDQLSQPESFWDVTSSVLSRLNTWWKHRMACTVDSKLTDVLYLDIVARFVGQATAVYVPVFTSIHVELQMGRQVTELGQTLARLILTLEQLDLMHRDQPRICITGPPGTGKTVVLVLQGLRWLLHGRDAHIVSSDETTRAASVFLKHQLKTLLKTELTSAPGRLHFHEFDLTSSAEVEKAINALSSKGKMSLNVLLDEANFSSYRSGQHLRTLVTELTGRVPHLNFWAACAAHDDIPPALQVEVLSTPLRFKREIVRELRPALAKAVDIHDYTEDAIVFPSDGPPVIRLSHHGEAHDGEWPVECSECGHQIATTLHHLGIGKQGPTLPGQPDMLRYKDVFVLTGSPDLHEYATDDDGTGRVISTDSGVVWGLRSSGLKVSVWGEPDMHRNKAEWIEDMAVAGTDQIIVAHWKFVRGLERKVVVWLETESDAANHDDGSDKSGYYMDRLFALSRCTTQLITVERAPLPSRSTADEKVLSDGQLYGESRQGGKLKASGVSWVKKKGFLL